MALLKLITPLCVYLSLVSSSSFASSLPSSLDQGTQLTDDPPLPRKLKLNKDTNTVTMQGLGDDKDLVTYNTKQKAAAVSGKVHHKGGEMMRGAKKGTRQEWKEMGRDSLEFFSMDYSHVRRRHPIHNKSRPVAP